MCQVVKTLWELTHAVLCVAPHLPVSAAAMERAMDEAQKAAAAKESAREATATSGGAPEATATKDGVPGAVETTPDDTAAKVAADTAGAPEGVDAPEAQNSSAGSWFGGWW